MENIYQIAFILLSSVGGAAIIIAVLSSWLGKVWANRILESDKARYTKELDKIRHQFEIERNQLSIIHDNQKHSFQRIIKSLEQEYDEEWHPINGKHYDELKEVAIEESLFLGYEGERALNIYLEFFGRAISFPETTYQSDKMLRNIYEHLIFMSERMREYFRKRIGLSNEEDPLRDVNLLAACLLINDYTFSEIDFPTKTILKFYFDSSPLSLIDNINGNIHILKSELKKFISYIESDIEERKSFFRTLTDARYYLKLIDEA